MTTPGRLAIVDGRTVAEAKATVPIDNPSFLSGFGVFDTLLLVDGAPVFWEAHLARLQAGVARLGIDWPVAVERLPARLAALAASNLSGAREGALRITVTPARLTADGPLGSFWVATVRPIPERTLRKRRGVRGAILRGGAGRTMPGIKSTSYVAPHLPLPAGANEWILADRRGAILEGGSSNLFLEVAGELRTPPLSAGLLPGIVREWVLARAVQRGIPVRMSRFEAADARGADGSFATASLTGLAAWVSLDGERLPGLGPIGRSLRADYRRELRTAGRRML